MTLKIDIKESISHKFAIGCAINLEKHVDCLNDILANDDEIYNSSNAFPVYNVQGIKGVTYWDEHKPEKFEGQDEYTTT